MAGNLLGCVWTGVCWSVEDAWDVCGDTALWSGRVDVEGSTFFYFFPPHEGLSPTSTRHMAPA
eukprot:2378505-Prymnesium_polylepis.1